MEAPGKQLKVGGAKSKKQTTVTHSGCDKSACPARRNSLRWQALVVRINQGGQKGIRNERGRQLMRPFSLPPLLSSNLL
jgi:hypothetical protein